MAERTIAIAFAPPNSSISIHLSVNPEKYITKLADGFGYASFQIDDSLGDSDIAILASNYKDYITHFKFKNNRDNQSEPKPLNQQVNVGNDIPSLIPINSITSLRINGRNFIDNSNKRIVLRGADAFLAFRKFIDNTSLDELYELKEIGFNLIRVFFMGSIKQNQVMQLDPTESYNKVRPFAELTNKLGFILLAEINVDAQDIMPREFDRRINWMRMFNELQGTNTILSYGNERGKNGTRDDEVQSVDMIWSRGSGLSDETICSNGASVQLFHPRRDMPKSLIDTVASPIYIYNQCSEVPLIIDEPRKFTEEGSGDTSNDSFLSYQFASIYKVMTTGAVFHNWFGQRGLKLGSATKECAIAWNEGLTI